MLNTQIDKIIASAHRAIHNAFHHARKQERGVSKDVILNVVDKAVLKAASVTADSMLLHESKYQSFKHTNTIVGHMLDAMQDNKEIVERKLRDVGRVTYEL